jgi:hypothetical protein
MYLNKKKQEGPVRGVQVNMNEQTGMTEEEYMEMQQ